MHFRTARFLNWFQRLAVVAAPFLCMVLVFAPVLFSSKYVLSFNENISYDYPLFLLQSETLLAGKPLSWNQYYVGGYPLHSSPVGNFSDVITASIVRATHDPFFSYHLRMVLSGLLGLAFSYLFGRSLGLTRLGSSIAGLVYFTGYTFDNFTANVAVTAGAFFSAPVLFWAINKFNSTRRVRYLLIGTAFLAWSMVWGLLQIVFYGMVLAGVYAIYLTDRSGR